MTDTATNIFISSIIFTSEKKSEYIEKGNK